jgi:hypothetical protein
MSTHACDEKYKRCRDALYKVLVSIHPRQDPAPLSPEAFLIWLRNMSEDLAHASVTGDTSYLEFKGMNRNRERKKLREIQTLARKLSRTVRGLHPHTSDMLKFASIGFRFSDMLDNSQPRESISDADMDFGQRFWQVLTELDRTIDKALPEADAWIDNAPELGKREQHIIAIVEVLRGLWRDVTGDDPPNFLNEDTRFGKFLASAFKAMKIKNKPRSTMDSWRKYRVSVKKAD